MLASSYQNSNINDVENSLLLDSTSINTNKRTNIFSRAQSLLLVGSTIAATFLVVALTSSNPAPGLRVSTTSLAGSLTATGDDDHLSTTYDEGYVVSIIGDEAAGSGYKDGMGTSALISSVYDVSFATGTGFMYFTDTANSLIRRYDTSTTEVTTYSGTGAEGYVNSDDLLTAQFNQPQGLIIKGDFCYVADTNNHVIRRIDTVNDKVETYAGNSISQFSGDDGDATSASLWNPTNVLFNSKKLYIADTYNNRIRVVNAVSGIITTYAGSSSTGAYHGDGGDATAAKLFYPRGIAMDSSDNLYIADSQNNVIRFVMESTGIITTVVGTGHQGYAGDGGDPLNAKLMWPDSVILSHSDDVLYITDSGNSVIRKVRNNIIKTVVGTIEGYTASGEAMHVEMNEPRGVAIDDDGNLFVADTENYVIRMWYLVSPTNAPTRKPTAKPTDKPTTKPTAIPVEPTTKPTVKPTTKPTTKPTAIPVEPTTKPTVKPTA